MMKKYFKIIFFVGIIFLVICGGYIAYKEYYKLELANIELIKYDKENNKITIKIDRVLNFINSDFICNANGEKQAFKELSNSKSCTLELPLNDRYEVFLSNEKGNKTRIIPLNNSLNEVLSFEFKSDTIYLIEGESKDIEYNDIKIGDFNYEFKVENESVAQIIDNKVIAKSVGETYIYSDNIKSKMKVIVTDLITKPYAIEGKKDLLTCNAYTEDEVKLLDNILKYKINSAGYKTRAGAVAAARFLTLEFAYRVPYFYENGRVHFSGVHQADGEGRYYKTGLYLADSKKEGITASLKGPAIWGCPLMNLESRPEYGYIMGRMMPNGLDCSGFVTWSLKNAGFDPGDIGAGESPEIDYQCTDLGEFVPLTKDLVYSGNLKAGDLINWWGHIGMIIGIDDKEEKIYVAESLSYIGGVRAMIYTKKNITDTFTYVVLMDKYYNEDGNYTQMW